MVLTIISSLPTDVEALFHVFIGHLLIFEEMSESFAHF
jgi:hypothetical protein